MLNMSEEIRKLLTTDLSPRLRNKEDEKGNKLDGAESKI